MKSLTLSPAVRFPLALLTLLSAGSSLILLSACSNKENPSSGDAPVAPRVSEPEPESEPKAHPEAPASATPEPTGEVAVEDLKPEDPAPPHPGPWFWVKRSSAGIYTEPRPDKDKKLGYVQIGAKVPVLAEKVTGEGCSKGWYQLISGGYICGIVGTTDETDPLAKFPPRQPDVDAILPYPYMRNAHNGTPLYRSLPSREQMYEYEPYLPAAKKAKEQAQKSEKGAKTSASTKSSSLGLGGAPGAGPADPPPWWESGENLHELTLEGLEKEGDGILAKRMMRGFYIAVDKTFPWNGRSWYKSTKGLVAPTDRFWKVAEFEFKGVEIDGETWKLPVAWPYGANKQIATYSIDEESKKITTKGSVKKFTAIQLTDKRITVAGKDYLETSEGTWVRASQVRATTPGTRPDGVGPEERWIDVDISQQTVVVFEGDRPVYATITSTGKESKIKQKDHSTPRGMWRVREKHIVATMDGDGSAAGDLPYSIEDVPYIMYFHRAYATHAAFWHQNFGVQMSHGCVNLSPLDAKWLFYHAEPRLPDGLHGVWSSERHPGSMVVVHD